MGYAPTVFCNHLIRYVQDGGVLDAGRVLALSRLQPDEQARALAAFAACGPEYLAPIYEALGGAIPYDELHVLRLYLRCRPPGTDPAPARS